MQRMHRALAGADKAVQAVGIDIGFKKCFSRRALGKFDGRVGHGSSADAHVAQCLDQVHRADVIR